MSFCSCLLMQDKPFPNWGLKATTSCDCSWPYDWLREAWPGQAGLGCLRLNSHIQLAECPGDWLPQKGCALWDYPWSRKLFWTCSHRSWVGCKTNGSIESLVMTGLRSSIPGLWMVFCWLMEAGKPTYIHGWSCQVSKTSSQNNTAYRLCGGRGFCIWVPGILAQPFLSSSITVSFGNLLCLLPLYTGAQYPLCYN